MPRSKAAKAGHQLLISVFATVKRMEKSQDLQDAKLTAILTAHANNGEEIQRIWAHEAVQDEEIAKCRRLIRRVERHVGIDGTPEPEARPEVDPDPETT